MSETIVKGDVELDRKFTELQDRQLSIAGRRAIRRGYQVIAQAQRERVREQPLTPGHDTQHMAKYIRGRTLKQSVPTLFEAVVGAGVASRRRPRHLGMYFLGSDDRFSAEGWFRGNMPGDDAIDRGYEDSKAQAETVMEETLQLSLIGFWDGTST